MKGLSVGIGLTNACNLNCAHCYRNAEQETYIKLDSIRQLCESIPISSVGLGTGENALNPEFEQIVEYLFQRGVRLTMASNGYSINAMSSDCLRLFHDIELSVDFSTEEEQDRFRGMGNWKDIQKAVDRCRSYGVETTFLATMMNINYHDMGSLANLARNTGRNLRVNVYQAVKSGAFKLSYSEFWEGFKRLFSNSLLLSCSEPVVCAAIGSCPAVFPCGRSSIRITPEERVTTCVYRENSPYTVQDLRSLGSAILETELFQQAREIPPEAENCPCQGGCASRRALNGNANGHDEYCPRVRGDNISLDVEMAPAKDLPRSANVCTTIVM